MASQGPQYPASAANLSNAGTSENTDAWVNPTNVFSDNGTEATITAASYDSPDISQILVASNFGFSVSGTINGITVEIDRRSIVASSGKDFRVQLATGTAFANLVGTNKAVPATIWPTTSTVATYGGSADNWSAGLTAAQVNAAGFAVFLSAQANIANADIGVDFIRVTVEYTPPTNTTVTPPTLALTTATFSPTVSTTANQTVTPGVLSLTTSAFAPTVTASDHKTVTPTTLALSSSTFAPVVTASDHQSVTPTTASLSTAVFAPTVTATAGTVATPETGSLTTTLYAPTVAATVHQTVTPDPATLSTTGLAPTVTTTDHQTVVPSPASLSLATFIPSVVATDPKTVTPGTASLSITGYAPSIYAGTTVTPDTGSLALTSYAPNVALTDNQLITPETAALALASFVPVVTALASQVVTPGTASLTLTTYAPLAGEQVPDTPGLSSSAVGLAFSASATVATASSATHALIGGASSSVELISE